MNLWTAVVIIVAIGCLVEIVRIVTVKRRPKIDPDALKKIDQVIDRMKAQDERISNLETIILDQQKDRKFDDLK